MCLLCAADCVLSRRAVCVRALTRARALHAFTRAPQIGCMGSESRRGWRGPLIWRGWDRCRVCARAHARAADRVQGLGFRA